jgi:hypothetical protein
MAELEREEKRACRESLRRRRGREINVRDGDYLDGDEVVWPGKMPEVEQGWHEIYVEERMREHWSFTGFDQEETEGQDEVAFENLPKPNEAWRATKQPEVEQWVLRC